MRRWEREGGVQESVRPWGIVYFLEHREPGKKRGGKPHRKKKRKPCRFADRPGTGLFGPHVATGGGGKGGKGPGGKRKGKGEPAPPRLPRVGASFFHAMIFYAAEKKGRLKKGGEREDGP